MTQPRSGESRQSGSRLRSGFRPQADGLEGRILLSVSAGSPLAKDQLREIALASVFPGVSTQSVRQLTNLTYRSDAGRRLTLDVYLPTRQAPEGGWPVLLAIHGGGWRRMSKEDFGPRAAVFVREGFVVVAPNYTLSTPTRPSWPANFQDVRAALAWTRARSSLYHINPSRVAAIGESAGGHLAELLGTVGPIPDGRAETARVQAVVALAGPSDLAALSRDSQQGAGLAVSQLLGGPPRRIRALYVDASPIRHVTADSAPMLLIHGISDRLVPPSQSLRMSAALQSAGVLNRVRLVPAEHRLDFRVAGQNLVPEIVAFLNEAMPRVSRPAFQGVLA